MHDHNEEEKEGHEFHHMSHPIKKEFKLAMLEKKEAILKAKLEFVGKMKALVQKMPDEKK